MGQTAKAPRENRTITVDFRDEATYFRLMADGKAFLECVLAFVLSIGFHLKHKATCGGGGCLTRHSHYVRVRLGDLVGAVGYPELRYRDGLAVEHRGEQRDLVVLVSPCTTHYLPVDRDFPLVVPAFPGLREKPRAGYHVQFGRIDPDQHAPYR